MNKFLLYISILFTTSLFAKKVKFAVDMTGQTISAFGVHVAGDFQLLAGYPMDWDYASTLLTQEGSSDVYSVIVDIPAFRKYEFKFVNGDQGYETEYVPDEIRVGHDFNDNRWMYVDSLSNDTSFIGTVQFGLTSPAGKFAVRYKVDMTNVGVSANRVHVSTNYDSFSAAKNTMYSFATNVMPNVYEVINYVDAGTYNFNFVNGNLISDKESSVPSTCSNSGLRYITITKDTVFPDICFNACVSCALTGVKENLLPSNEITVYPNPAKNMITVSSNNALLSKVDIYTMSGQHMISEAIEFSNKHIIKNIDLATGLYIVRITDSNNNYQNIKLLID